MATPRYQAESCLCGSRKGQSSTALFANILYGVVSRNRFLVFILFPQHLEKSPQGTEPKGKILGWSYVDSRSVPGWAWASWVPEHGSFPWDLPVLPSLGMLSSHFTLIWLQCYSNIPAEPLIPPFILGCRYWFSQVTLAVNKPPANAGDIRECRVQSLGREDLREEGMTTHSSILAWRIPWTEEAGKLQFIESQSWTRLKQLSTHVRMALG